MAETGLRSAAAINAKRFWAAQIVAASLLAVHSAAEAETRIDKTHPYSIGIYITGTITERDAQTFQEVSNDFEYIEPVLYLDSKGGSVSAAMQIGRLTRKYDGTTLVSGSCYSSCALIFIAGVVRIIPTAAQELGLHRPYLAAAPQSRENVEKQVPLMLSMVKSYVAEMDITDNFYQQMVNTEPSQIIIYKEGNYENLVPRRDPVYDEIRISYEARKYGVSTSEYRQREQETKRCGPIWDSKWETCAKALLWGLSESVYLERKAKGSCDLTFEEAVKKVPRKLQGDDPVTLRLETCRRNIMLGR
jgi:hypothetical protein